MRKLALAALVVSILLFLVLFRKEPRHAAAPDRPPAPLGPPRVQDVALDVEPAPAAEALIEAGPSTRTVEIPVDPAAPLGDRREAVLEFDPPLRAWADEGDLPLGATRFRFFDGVERELVFALHEATVEQDGGVFVGTVAGVPGSYVVLAHVDDAVAGTISIPGQGLYRIRTREGGELRLTLMDADAIPVELPPIVTQGDGQTPPADAPADAPPALSDANTVVDILTV